MISATDLYITMQKKKPVELSSLFLPYSVNPMKILFRLAILYHMDQKNSYLTNFYFIVY